jgi:hypothetical protein
MALSHFEMADVRDRGFDTPSDLFLGDEPGERGLARGGLREVSGLALKIQPGGRGLMPRVRPDKQQKERSDLKKRLKEISGQMRARSAELQDELSPENYKRVEDLIRLIESYDAVVVQLLKLPMGLSGGRSARSA